MELFEAGGSGSFDRCVWLGTGLFCLVDTCSKAANRKNRLLSTYTNMSLVAFVCSNGMEYVRAFDVYVCL